MNTKFLLSAFCLATSAAALFGTETEAGIQGSLVFPQQDLRSATGGRTGFQVGVHGAVDLGGGSELRPRIDYTRVDGGSFSLGSLTSTTTVHGVGIGADFLKYLDERRRGLYGFGGLALTWWSSDYRFGGTTRLTSPSVIFGVGHRFNSSVGMEFSVDFGQFRSSAGAYSDIKGGVFYRF
jgi:hypothetical protein